MIQLSAIISKPRRMFMPSFQKFNRMFYALMLSIFLAAYPAFAQVEPVSNGIGSENSRSVSIGGPLVIRSAIRGSVSDQTAGGDREFIDSTIAFSFDVFGKCEAAAEYKNNVFISPYSIAAAITLVYNGAGKNTAVEIEKALRLKNPDIVKYNAFHQSLRKRISGLDPKVTIEVANSLWAKKGLNYKKKFIDFNIFYHEAESRILETAKIVNDWVSAKTHDKITQIVDNEAVGRSLLILINAIYFKGTWSCEFKKENTKPAKFNTPHGEKNCNRMSASGEYYYFENKELQAIYLPYGNEKIGMYVFLPAKNIKFADFIKKINSASYKQYLDGFFKRDGRVELPKFKIEYAMTLNDQLKSLGIKDAFEDRADFSKIFEVAEKIKISQVIHKTFVDVNEEGTEAAAVTAIFAIPGCAAGYAPPKPFEMIVDRPFFFAITERETKSILFMGAITEP